MLRITRQQLKILLIVTLVAGSGFLGVDIHLPSMPYIMKFFHTNQSYMQQSISLFLLGLGASLLVYGPLSDKYGRKPMMIAGLCIAVLANFAVAYSTEISFFLILRLLQGIGAGACVGLGRVIIADIFTGNRFASIGAYFALIVGLSPVLAPMIGAYIQSWLDWQANFVILGGVSLVALASYVLFCPETNRHNDKSLSCVSLIKNYKVLLTHRVFISFTVLSSIGVAANMVYATTSTFILQMQYHVSVVQYGWLTILVGLGGISGKLFLPFFIKKFTRKGSLLIGMVCLLLIGLLLSICTLLHAVNLIVFIIALCVALFSQSLIVICATTDALTPHHKKRGAAGALFGTCQMLLSFIVSALISFWTNNSIFTVGIAYILLSLLGLFLYVFIEQY